MLTSRASSIKAVLAEYYGSMRDIEVIIVVALHARLMSLRKTLFNYLMGVNTS